MATLALDTDRLAMLRGIRPDLKTNRAFAEALEVNEGHLSRVLRGEGGIGETFIAGLANVFGKKWLAELLIVNPDEDGEVGDETDTPAA